MKQFLKRGLAILTAFILCLQFGKIDAQAANVVIALSASTVSVGNNVTATISVSGSDISAYTIYVSYNSSVLQYNSASGSAIVNGGGGTVTASGTSAFEKILGLSSRKAHSHSPRKIRCTSSQAACQATARHPRSESLFCVFSHQSQPAVLSDR